MKPLKYAFLFLWLTVNLFAQELQPIKTTNNTYSPSVFAKQTAVSYGLFPRVVDELKAVFEQDGHSVLEQEQMVKTLLDKYQILPEQEKAG